MVAPNHVQEGFSLSSITQLAATPPEDFKTHVADFPRTTLVLYIARVPGSRDVFLTTLKPRDRVVSAEDVQSCLYYVHVHSEYDQDLLHNGQTIETPDTRHSNQGENIRRKPLQRREGEPHAVQARISTEQEKRLSIGPLGPRMVSSHPLPPLPTETSSEAPFVGCAFDQDCDTPSLDLHEEGRLFDMTNGSHSPSSLTLIRRDPGTTHQWNVARISDPPVAEIASPHYAALSPNRVKKAGAPLYIDVTNPGYDCFRGKDDSSPCEVTRPFQRRLYMPGSRHAKHGYESWDQGADYHDRSSPRTDSRSRGYTFDSPWGMPCEFKTGVTGRSLKCRGMSGAQRHADLSELRFNLPTYPSRSGKAAASDMDAARQRRSSYIQRQHSDAPGNDRFPTVLFDEDGRIDLSLGREEAGGGFGGRHAKLGKLLIEPDGLKMLDLLVAANIGLWWRAYERMR